MKNPKFFDCFNYLWSYSSNHNLSLADIVLYMILLNFYNQNMCRGPFALSSRRIYAVTGMSIKTISVSRKRLADAGLIQFTPGKSTSDLPLYTLIDPDIIKKMDLSNDFFCNSDLSQNAGSNHSQNTGSNHSQNTGSDHSQNAGSNNSQNAGSNVGKNNEKGDLHLLLDKNINININNNNNSGAPTETDDDYKLQFFSEGNKALLEQFAMSLSTSVEQIRSLAQETFCDWSLTRVQHSTYSEFSSHLLNTIRIKYRTYKKQHDENNNRQPKKFEYEFERRYRLQHPELFDD